MLKYVFITLFLMFISQNAFAQKCRIATPEEVKQYGRKVICNEKLLKKIQPGMKLLF